MKYLHLWLVPAAAAIAVAVVTAGAAAVVRVADTPLPAQISRKVRDAISGTGQPGCIPDNNTSTFVIHPCRQRR